MFDQKFFFLLNSLHNLSLIKMSHLMYVCWCLFDLKRRRRRRINRIEYLSKKKRSYYNVVQIKKKSQEKASSMIMIINPVHMYKWIQNPIPISYLIKLLICCQIYTKQKYLHYIIIILITKNPKFIYIMQYIWRRRTKQKNDDDDEIEIKLNWNGFIHRHKANTNTLREQRIYYIYSNKSGKRIKEMQTKMIIMMMMMKIGIINEFHFFSHFWFIAWIYFSLTNKPIFIFHLEHILANYIWWWWWWWQMAWAFCFSISKMCVCCVRIFFPYSFCFNIYTEQRIYVLIE